MRSRSTLNRFDPDYYPLQLGNHVLGGGFYATRLYHDLRQVAATFTTWTWVWSASKTRASYSVNYGCDPENVSKARALMQRDLDQMRTENVSDARAATGQGAAAAADSVGRIERGSGGGRLAGPRGDGLPLDEPIRAAKRYCELNADEVKAAFAKHVQPDDLVQIVRGPAPQ